MAKERAEIGRERGKGICIERRKDIVSSLYKFTHTPLCIAQAVSTVDQFLNVSCWTNVRIPEVEVMSLSCEESM